MKKLFFSLALIFLVSNMFGYVTIRVRIMLQFYKTFSKRNRSIKTLAVILLFSTQSVAQVLSPVVFSYPAGFYPDSIFVVITSPDAGVTIHYTLNGSEPTQSSLLYTAPVLIKNKVGIPNKFSLIKTNPSFSYPINGYDATKANTRGWLPPYSEINKATVLKAKAFATGFTPNFATVATYFIDPLLTSRYSLPVVSVSIDSMYLFADSAGIYVYGRDTLAGGNYRDDVEVPGHFELFELDGSTALSQDCGFSDHGGGGRIAPQKSFKVQARINYGPNTFSYKFFADKSTHTFKNFVLRNGGHRPDCITRDDLSGTIVSNMNIDVQSCRQVISFINGEYWGVQTIKDEFDEHFIQHKYNVSDSDIVIMQDDGSLAVGISGDDAHYLNMVNFATANDMTDTNNYNYINTQMDIMNYIDYQSAEVYFGNGDWPDNNIKYWRKRLPSYSPGAGVNLDGRWRWLFFDLDAAFGGDCDGINYTYNSLLKAVTPSLANYTILLRSMLLSPEFKNLFINRAADLLNTEFLKWRVASFATDINTEYTPEIMEHVTRWRYPVTATTLATRATAIPSITKWNQITSGLQTFAVRRPSKVMQQYMMYFGLADTVAITVNVSDTAAGRVKISTLIIDNNTVGLLGLPYPWTGKYFTGVPIPLKAVARPGYHFIEWLSTGITNPNIIINPTTNVVYTAVFGADAVFVPYHSILINEVSSHDSTFIADEYGEYDDWFEFYNPNNFAVDIDNYYVTDSLGFRTKYRFTSGFASTIIPANGWLLLWADDDTEQGVLHTNFKFANTGEALVLTLPDGHTVVDSVLFGSQTINHSWGRHTDGDSIWFDFTTPTPGFSNNQITVTVPEKEHQLPLVVYPNPATHTDKIYFSKYISFTVYSSLGQLILKADNAISLCIANLQGGVYFIRTDKGETIKFVKL